MHPSMFAALASLTPACVLGSHCDRAAVPLGAGVTNAGGVLDIELRPGETQRLVLAPTPGADPTCVTAAVPSVITVATTTVTTTLAVGCGALGDADFTIELPDTRDFDVMQATLPTGSYRITAAVTGDQPRCTAPIAAALSIDVGDAHGGRAPYPELVTDDFLRSFDFGFDIAAGSYAGTDDRRLPCTLDLAAQRLYMHVVQDTTSYRADGGDCR